MLNEEKKPIIKWEIDKKLRSISEVKDLYVMFDGKVFVLMTECDLTKERMEQISKEINIPLRHLDHHNRITGIYKMMDNWLTVF